MTGRSAASHTMGCAAALSCPDCAALGGGNPTSQQAVKGTQRAPLAPRRGGWPHWLTLHAVLADVLVPVLHHAGEGQKTRPSEVCLHGGSVSRLQEGALAAAPPYKPSFHSSDDGVGSDQLCSAPDSRGPVSGRSRL